MPLPRRGLYWAEVNMSLLSACLFVLTLVDLQWIERWFDASPAGGDGSVERWLVGGGFLLAALLASALARRERRQGPGTRRAKLTRCARPARQTQ